MLVKTDLNNNYQSLDPTDSICKTHLETIEIGGISAMQIMVYS